MTTNFEIQTAKVTLEKLATRKTEEVALSALANEHEIIRLAKRIEQVLGILARDYAQMASSFAEHGETTLYTLVNELPELKVQLRCRKEARNLYAELLR